MKKEERLEILVDWNFWQRELNTGIKRDEYTRRAGSFLKTNMILSILGVRRSGKSFIMRQIVKNLIDSGLDPKETLFINFEDRRFKDFSVNILDEILDTYLEFIKPASTPYVFVDEVQLIDRWERWARTMNELQKAKLIVSGSTSQIISKELASTLTGRHLDLKVFPLSFKEFLKFKKIEIKNFLDLINKKIELRRSFREYARYGGFPEAVLGESKNEILIFYFEDILTKDIVKRFSVKKIDKLEALAKFYLTNISNSITFNSLGRTLKISKDTVEKYSWYLENAFLFFFIKRFSFSLKEQDNSPRKVYSLDVGLSNAMGFRFSENFGKVMENIAAVELLRRAAQNPLMEIYYWKDVSGKEVDFVVKEGIEVKGLIQVTYASSKEEIAERELSALIKAMKEFKLKEGLILTEELEGEEEVNGYVIKYKPLWKWLLAS
ncbi:MAG: ATP-binding protein [Candidatus Methanoperedens sp.]|nr:ATP-binding protein [Candidatus Methanoperedens sp.]